MSLVFKVWLSKGEKAKNEGRKKQWPFNPLEVKWGVRRWLATVRGDETMAVCLFVPLWSEAPIRDQGTDLQHLEDKVLFCPP